MGSDPSEYLVVVNQEEQYSLWAANKALPLGWSRADFSGTKEECLEHVEKVWTDMRPLSLRQAIDNTA
ncbi:MAG: MbtH family protein [Congregibacter sp.]